MGRQRSLSHKKMEELVGKLGRIGQAYRPTYNIMPHMYALVASALRGNEYFLASTSRNFRKMMTKAKQKKTAFTPECDLREINFSIGQLAQKVHQVKNEYIMPESLKEEIKMMRRILRDESIDLATPLAHIVPQKENFEEAADACKRAGGGWSIDLRFWWHLAFCPDVVRQARLPNNKKEKLITINCLEFACVVTNFAAAIYACHVDDIDLSNYPVLLNWCDNIAATCWVNIRCESSTIGCNLAKLFIGLLMGTNLGIQAK